MTELMVGALGGLVGAAFWHGLVMLWRRKRFVVRTREMVLESPDVVEIPGPDSVKAMWSQPPGALLHGEPGQMVFRPAPRRKIKKLSQREKALRALRGGS
jgi:hypothetical protein